jgi:hypothetical protein
MKSSSSSRGRKSTIVLSSSDIEHKPSTIFHFNPSDECVKAVAGFSEQHRDYKNKQFKLAWDEWIQHPEVSRIIASEIARLSADGYKGDIMSKLYFSARYYFRKKSLSESESLPQEKKARKTYEATDQDTLVQMNNDILSQIKATPQIRPATAFETYAKTHPINGEEEKTRLKKVYKNRFFTIRKKIEVSKTP